MKKIFTNFLGLALSVMVLASCSQVATYEQADMTPEEVAAAKNGFNLTPYGIGGNENAALLSCTECIEEPVVATSVVSKTAGPNTSNYGDLSVWNTETDLIVTYAFYGTVGADGSSINIGGTVYSWVKDGAVSAGISDVVVSGNGKILSYKVTHPLTVKTACTSYSVSFASNGGPGGSLSKSTSYAIYEYCSDCDEESFSYVATNANLDVTFSYNYSKVAEMTLTFTLPQVKIVQATGTTYVGADGKSYVIGGNGTNLTWTGNVSCSNESPTTFEFDFVADCGPSTANDGNANIWTDATVKAINGIDLVDDPLTLNVNEGPYSLKGALASIVYAGCPVKVKP